MFTFILLLMWYDPRTMRVITVLEPVPTFTSRAKCERAADWHAHDARVPPGIAVWAKCFSLSTEIT